MEKKIKKRKQKKKNDKCTTQANTWIERRRKKTNSFFSQFKQV